jgi:hypothetical protein
MPPTRPLTRRPSGEASRLRGDQSSQREGQPTGLVEDNDARDPGCSSESAPVSRHSTFLPNVGKLAVLTSSAGRRGTTLGARYEWR